MKSTIFVIILAISLALISACAPVLGTLEVGVVGEEEPTSEATNPAPQTTEVAGPPTPSLGSVEGKVCYPSESIPAMTAYFQHQESDALTAVPIAENQEAYAVDLQPGTYIAFAYTQEPVIGGMYSAAVACGLSVECTDHTPLPFQVIAGQAIQGIDLCDWYAQEQVPPSPESSLQPGPYRSISGLVYSDVSANETWRINQNGFPEKVYPQAGGLPSPDGTKLLLEREDDLWVANLIAGTETNLTGGNQRLEADGQWWPANPDTIVFSSIDLEQGWGMSAGQPTTMSLEGTNYQTLADTSGFWGPAPSPSGDTIAFDSGDAAWLYHLDSGSREQFDTAAMGMETPADLKIGSPSWSPDGNQIAWWVGASFGGGPFQMGLVVFDLQGKSARFLHQYQPVGGSGGWLPPAQWSPDGQWLAFTTRDERRTPVLWVARGDGGAAHDLGEGALPLWSPDSQQIIYVTYDDTGNFAGMSVVNRQAWQPMALDLPPASQPIAWLEH